MSALSLPSTFEKRTAAILFCEAWASGWSADGLSDRLSPELRESFDSPSRELLKQHGGTFVTAVANTFIALFETVHSAVQFSLALQEALALDPRIISERPSEASEKPAAQSLPRLEVRFSVHYGQLYVEAIRPSRESFTDRLGHALRSTILRKPEIQTARVGGKGLNVAARLLRRVPPSGIGLSDEAHANLGSDLSKSFRKVMPVQNSGTFGESTFTPLSHLPVWLYATTRGVKEEQFDMTMLSAPMIPAVRTSLRNEVETRGPMSAESALYKASGVANSQAQASRQEFRPATEFRVGKDDLVQIERLLNPIPGEDPAGSNIQYSAAFQQIKEARTEDDDSLPAGVWSTTPRKADWVLVEKLSREALTSQTKDLRLVGWYLEALVHRTGFAAIPLGLELIRRLQEDFWETVHPALEEDGNVELRSAAIEGATNILAAAATLVPLTRDGVNWLKFQEARAAGSGFGTELQKDVYGTPKAFYVEIKTLLEESLDRLLVLNEFQKKKFGDDYPRTDRLKSKLEEIRAVISSILAEKRHTEPDAVVAAAAESELMRLLRAMDTETSATQATNVGANVQLVASALPAPQVAAPNPTSTPQAGGFTRTFQAFTISPPASAAALAPFVSSSPINCASEAIVVIDIVQATATSDLFGWYSVGRHSVRHLRQTVREIGELYGLACMKSTGDGLLLTYRDDMAADLAAVHAVQASLDLLKRLSAGNETAPEERQIAIRLALHFGEVDVLPDDREGPNVSFTFRVEAINHASLDKALNPIDPALLPLRDYILCSERIYDIVDRRKPEWRKTSCGLFKLKGFTSWHELFLVSEQPRSDA